MVVRHFFDTSRPPSQGQRVGGDESQKTPALRVL
jgi:hypothetical protein